MQTSSHDLDAPFFFFFLRGKGEVIENDPVIARKGVKVNSTILLAWSADPLGM